MITHFSYYIRLQRTIAWCRRFAFKCRHKKGEREISALLQEIVTTEHILLHLSQSRWFRIEIEAISRKNETSKTSIIKALRPFIDENGLLWVGGRLNQSQLSFSLKHPIILHPKDWLSQLLILHLHTHHQHASPTALMGILHVSGAKCLAMDLSKSCVTCRKKNGRTLTQVMGQPSKQDHTLSTFRPEVIPGNLLW